jgi:hypothetical protein
MAGLSSARAELASTSDTAKPDTASERISPVIGSLDGGLSTKPQMHEVHQEQLFGDHCAGKQLFPISILKKQWDSQPICPTTRVALSVLRALRAFVFNPTP